MARALSPHSLNVLRMVHALEPATIEALVQLQAAEDVAATALLAEGEVLEERPHPRAGIMSLTQAGFVASLGRVGKTASYAPTPKGRKTLDAARELLLHPKRTILRPAIRVPCDDAAKAERARKATSYQGGELEAGLGCMRPGCQQFLTIPSRFGDRLHYRDGRVTTLTGEPL